MPAPTVNPWWREEYPDQPEIWKVYEDFKVFLKLTWKHLGLPTPTPIQLDIADYLQHGRKRRQIQGFRGVGKSYVTSAFVCWLLLRDPDEAIMVVSASKQRADDFSTFTLRLITEMSLLQHLIPTGDQRSSKIAFDVGPARAKHAPSVKSVGIMGQLTGSRASIIIADDIEVPNNSETQQMRDKLAERIKEFDAVLMPGGDIIFLGTPQTEQSVYNKLAERGYEIRVWPSEVKDAEFYDRMHSRLAPIIHEMIENGLGFGTSTDPKRFSDEDLLERKLSYGAAGYALQFLLDTSLSDAERYPLKLKDLIVLPLDDETGPARVVWGPKPDNRYNDLITPGLDGDAFYRPAFISPDYQEYTGAIMFVDPSGRGADETAYAVAKCLNATVYITAAGGIKGGYEDHVLVELADIARRQKVNMILVEENFGQGMFAKLLQPHVLSSGHKCLIEEVRSNRQKELRICDTLEPLMNQHRLVVSEKVIQDDDITVQDYPRESSSQYRLFYQMTRISRQKGALVHDDRLDALAGAVAYWVEVMSQDQEKAAEKALDKAMREEIKNHLKNQVVAFEKPRKTLKPRFRMDSRRY